MPDTTVQSLGRHIANDVGKQTGSTKSEIVALVIGDPLVHESGAMPVAPKYPKKGFLELLVGERVAERVDGAVEVTQPVGDVVEQSQAAAVGQRTEPDDE